MFKIFKALRPIRNQKREIITRRKQMAEKSKESKEKKSKTGTRSWDSED